MADEQFSDDREVPESRESVDLDDWNCQANYPALPLILATRPDRYAIGARETSGEQTPCEVHPAAETWARYDGIRHIDILLDVIQGASLRHDVQLNSKEVAHAVQILLQHRFFNSPANIGLESPAHILLETVLKYRCLWIREPASWNPPPGDAYSALSDLFGHLFFRYPVPAWLDPRGASGSRDWSDHHWLALAISVGRGESLHEGLAYLCSDRRGEPLLSRRASHMFGSAPSHLGFHKAAYYAIARAQSGDSSWAEDIASVNDAPHPMFGADTVRELVSWLHRQREHLSPGVSTVVTSWAFRRLNCELIEARISFRRVRPIAFRNRSLRNVLNDCLAPCGYRGFSSPDITQELAWHPHHWDRALALDGRLWFARELRSALDLASEAVEMQHCAFELVSRCATGETVVFSLRHDGHRRVTLQMCPRSRRLLQIRGHLNREPLPEEQQAANAWVRWVQSLPIVEAEAGKSGIPACC